MLFNDNDWATDDIIGYWYFLLRQGLLWLGLPVVLCYVADDRVDEILLQLVQVSVHQRRLRLQSLSPSVIFSKGFYSISDSDPAGILKNIDYIF